jgi:putative Mg2+ transporter-C (MgtC) family protein
MWEMTARLLAACACGAAIGWERESQDKPAGLRTHMLVALGLAGFTLVTWNLCVRLETVEGQVSRDPIRLIEGVIGGIGFLGAGAIIEARGAVRGITTAAAVWVVGGLGVACGLGEHVIATMLVFISVAILLPLGYLEGRVKSGGV